MSKIVNLMGRAFGRLTVTSVAGINKSGNKTWNCRCDCGVETVVNSSNLIRGITKSCGCYKSERCSESNIKHGKSGTGTHSTWMSMRQRCLNTKSAAYPDYGGRGIKICDRWSLFENFLFDMGERQTGMEIDRIDVDGNYEPGNCRWANQLQQHRNQRKTLFATIDGETRCLTEWLEIYPINYKTVMSRYHTFGWSLEKSITTPLLRTVGKRKKDLFQ